MKAADRLSAMIEERDEKIAELESELEEAKEAAVSDRRTWALPREIKDKHPELPIPRLEFVWEDLSSDWSSFIVEYRLVRRHLLGHLEVTPMGNTSVNGGGGRKPWKGVRGVYDLPFRDGSHATHDSAHLGLPLYAVPPDEPPHLIDEAYGFVHQRTKGSGHRRD